jgi:hypothetical protein
MADQEKRTFEIENLEVAELEDEDLEGVSGGDPIIQNASCPMNMVQGCGAPSVSPNPT